MRLSKEDSNLIKKYVAEGKTREEIYTLLPHADKRGVSGAYQYYSVNKTKALSRPVNCFNSNINEVKKALDIVSTFSKGIADRKSEIEREVRVCDLMTQTILHKITDSEIVDDREYKRLYDALIELQKIRRKAKGEDSILKSLTMSSCTGNGAKALEAITDKLNKVLEKNCTTGGLVVGISDNYREKVLQGLRGDDTAKARYLELEKYLGLSNDTK